MLFCCVAPEMSWANNVWISVFWCTVPLRSRNNVNTKSEEIDAVRESILHLLSGWWHLPLQQDRRPAASPRPRNSPTVRGNVSICDAPAAGCNSEPSDGSAMKGNACRCLCAAPASGWLNIVTVSRMQKPVAATSRDERVQTWQF